MDQLCSQLREIFANDEINTELVKNVLHSYKSSEADWGTFAIFDGHKYTRNLVDIGNGKYNLMLLCWGPGMGSSIHDHMDAHCFVKVLHGCLLETRFEWPDEKTPVKRTEKSRTKPMTELERIQYQRDGVTYINDEIGLHRMENPSHSESAITLHLYIPPYDHCNVFDQRTGRRTNCKITFWSEFGEKLNPCQTLQNPKMQQLRC